MFSQFRLVYLAVTSRETYVAQVHLQYAVDSNDNIIVISIFNMIIVITDSRNK